jgi:hypothetical protein
VSPTSDLLQTLGPVRAKAPLPVFASLTRYHQTSDDMMLPKNVLYCGKERPTIPQLARLTSLGLEPRRTPSHPRIAPLPQKCKRLSIQHIGELCFHTTDNQSCRGIRVNSISRRYTVCNDERFSHLTLSRWFLTPKWYFRRYPPLRSP